jgi:hypothetical protein
MWVYLAVAIGVIVAFEVLIVLVVAVLARHAETVDVPDSGVRARLKEYARRAA